MKKILFAGVFCCAVQPAVAEVSATLEYDFPMGITLELGKYTGSNYFYGSASHSNLYVTQLNRYELGWYTPISENKRHNVGLSAGMLQAKDLNDFLFFKELKSDKKEKAQASVVSAKYAYYLNGISNSGLKFEAELILGNFKEVGGSVGVGYKFNF